MREEGRDPGSDRPVRTERGSVDPETGFPRDVKGDVRTERGVGIRLRKKAKGELERVDELARQVRFVSEGRLRVGIVGRHLRGVERFAVAAAPVVDELKEAPVSAEKDEIAHEAFPFPRIVRASAKRSAMPGNGICLGSTGSRLGCFAFSARAFLTASRLRRRRAGHGGSQYFRGRPALGTSLPHSPQ
jgi:hypothetical protein